MISEDRIGCAWCLLYQALLLFTEMGERYFDYANEGPSNLINLLYDKVICCFANSPRCLSCLG